MIERFMHRYGYLFLGVVVLTGSFFVGTVNAATVVLTQSATGVSHDRAQLNGMIFPADDSAIITWFEWGTSTDTNNTTAEQFLNPGGGTVSFRLTGLRENETYFFRVAARTPSSNQVTRGSLFSFTTTDEDGAFFDFGDPFGSSPPIAFTLNATRVSKESATLNGFVDTEDDTTFWFEWGSSPSLGRSTGSVSVDEAYENISRKITGLNEGETYYFRAVSRNANGTSEGGILQFTAEGENFYGYDDDDNNNNNDGTSGPPTSPFRPRVQTRDAFALSNGTAVLQGRAENIRGNETTVWFQWGSTNGLGNVTLPQAFNVNTFTFSTPIGGLTNGQRYFYRAVGDNEYGTTLGETLTFIAGENGSTGGGGGDSGEDFRVFTTEAADIGTDSATVGGLTVPERSGTTSYIAWGTTRDLNNAGSIVATSNIGSTNAFTTTLTGLSPNTIYYYQAVATDEQDTVRGSVLSFRTQSSSSGGGTQTPQPGPITRGSIFLTAKNIDSENGTDTALAANPGDTLVYTTLVRNIGTRRLNNIEIFGKLNPFVEFLSSTPGGEYIDQTRDVKWSIDVLGPGEEQEISLRVLVNGFTESAVAEQNFIMESGDFIKRSNTANVVLSVSPVAFTISARPNDADPGDRVRYTAEILNDGEYTLDDVELRLTFPQGIRFLDSDEGFRAAGRTAILSIGTLESGDKLSVRFNGEVENIARQGEEFPLIGLVSYRDTELDERGDVTSIATVVVGGSFFGGRASIFGAGFFPSTLIGWLALLLLLILIILLGVKLYELFIIAKRDEDEEQQRPPVIVAGKEDDEQDDSFSAFVVGTPEDEKKLKPPIAAVVPDDEEEEVLRISDLPRE